MSIRTELQPYNRFGQSPHTPLKRPLKGALNVDPKSIIFPPVDTKNSSSIITPSKRNLDKQNRKTREALKRMPDSPLKKIMLKELANKSVPKLNPPKQPNPIKPAEIPKEEVIDTTPETPIEDIENEVVSEPENEPLILDSDKDVSYSSSDEDIENEVVDTTPETPIEEIDNEVVSEPENEPLILDSDEDVSYSSSDEDIENEVIDTPPETPIEDIDNEVVTVPKNETLIPDSDEDDSYLSSDLDTEKNDITATNTATETWTDYSENDFTTDEDEIDFKDDEEQKPEEKKQVEVNTQKKETEQKIVEKTIVLSKEIEKIEPKQEGMSTKTKVALGALGVAIAGVGGYYLYKYFKAPKDVPNFPDSTDTSDFTNPSTDTPDFTDPSTDLPDNTDPADKIEIITDSEISPIEPESAVTKINGYYHGFEITDKNKRKLLFSKHENIFTEWQNNIFKASWDTNELEFLQNHKPQIFCDTNGIWHVTWFEDGVWQDKQYEFVSDKNHKPGFIQENPTVNVSPLKYFDVVAGKIAKNSVKMNDSAVSMIAGFLIKKD